MVSSELLRLLSKHEASYIKSHPNTGEVDVNIAKRFWQGCSAVLLAQDIPCSESTIYRSVRRVREYLLGSDCFDQLRDYVLTNPPNYGDGNARSILDMLFCHYEEFNRFDTDAIQEGFQQIYNELDEVSLQQLDYVIHKTCELCREHEMAGFTEGIKVDVKLRIEFYR